MKLILKLIVLTITLATSAHAEKIKFDFDGIETGTSGSNNSPIIFLTSNQYPQYFYYLYCNLRTPLALVLTLDSNDPDSGNLVRAGYSQFEKAEECDLILDCAINNSLSPDKKIEMVLDSETGLINISSLPKACEIPMPAPEDNNSEDKPETKSDTQPETSESKPDSEPKEEEGFFLN